MSAFHVLLKRVLKDVLQQNEGVAKEEGDVGLLDVENDRPPK